MINKTKAIKLKADAVLKTPLIIKSGESGEISDSVVQKTPDNKVYINGYVIANLLKRASKRLKENKNIETLISPEEEGSSFWIESSFIHKATSNIIPGIKIDRELGSAKEKALYSDEIIAKGESFKTNMLFLLSDSDNCEEYREIFSKIFGIINSGIENIGGLWSYGYGRIEIFNAKYKILDLKNETDRAGLWDFTLESEFNELTILTPTKDIISNGWCEIDASLSIPSGQIFAIHSNMPILDNLKYEHLPDNFLFRTFVKNKGEEEAEPVITISGKAIRQGIFFYNFERELKSKGKYICNFNIENYNCERYNFFGSQDKRGIIAVTDGYIEDTMDNTEIISRVELCEHSFQNKNLFSEEYLTKGDFKVKIFIDKKDENFPKAKDLIIKVLEQMKESENYPPNWFRIGANTTCAGIVRCNEYKIKDF